jgi:hypothetical protein
MKRIVWAVLTFGGLALGEGLGRYYSIARHEHSIVFSCDTTARPWAKVVRVGIVRTVPGAQMN